MLKKTTEWLWVAGVTFFYLISLPFIALYALIKEKLENDS